MKGCVVIQTCDSYSKYWPGLCYSMEKYWDKEIPWPIYFCNEEADVEFPASGIPYRQLKTGKGSHSQRMAILLDKLEEYDYVFYMLEDFWPTGPMTMEMFMGIADMAIENKWDGLRLSHFMPNYYTAEASEYTFNGQKLLKYKKDSEWQFSQQTTFWKRDFLRKCIVEPDLSETVISSSLTGEIAMDTYLRKNFPDASIYHYHYFWYPIAGVVWRGELTQIGQQIEYLMWADQEVKRMLS